jgi:curved DNA-binding protein CbpA
MSYSWYKKFVIASRMTLGQALGILELNPGDSVDQVKKKYRELAQKFHPDRNKDVGSHDKMVLINAAYEFISSNDFYFL